MSDPGAIARKEIAKNFPKFGTIRKLVVYRIVSELADYTNGAVTEGPTIDFTFYVIFLNVKTFDFATVDDDPVLHTDKACIFPIGDMQGNTPKPNDIVMEGMSKWVVRGAKVDPADATWKLWVRPA